MKCMFCPIRSEDRRLLAAHIRSAHEDKCHSRTLAAAVERGGSGRELIELQVTAEVDIDALHQRTFVIGIDGAGKDDSYAVAPGA